MSKEMKVVVTFLLRISLKTQILHTEKKVMFIERGRQNFNVNKKKIKSILLPENPKNCKNIVCQPWLLSI